MPENSNVFVAEDDEIWQGRIQRILDEAGHRVVFAARDMPTALAAIAAGKLQELKVSVATLDGNLSKGSGSGADGEALLAAIRQQAPGVKIVGMGGIAVRGADVNVGKGYIRELGLTITNL